MFATRGPFAYGSVLLDRPAPRMFGAWTRRSQLLLEPKLSPAGRRQTTYRVITGSS